MNIDKLTEDQAKDQLAFYMELTNTQSNEIGRLTTELMKSNMTTRNLQQALKGMVDAAKENPKKGAQQHPAHNRNRNRNRK